MGARRNHEEGTQMSAFDVCPMDIQNGLLDRRVDISLRLVDMTLRHLLTFGLVIMLPEPAFFLTNTQLQSNHLLIRC